MKKRTSLFFTAATTLAVGVAVILGNGWAVSEVLAANISEETPPQVSEMQNVEQRLESANDVSGEPRAEDFAVSFSPNADDLVIQYAPNVTEGVITVTIGDLGETEVITLAKALENGEIILVQYNGNVRKAEVVYPSGEVEYLEGDALAITFERFGGVQRYTPTYVRGEPGAGDIAEDEAISLGVAAIVAKYALKQELLDRYDISAVYYRVYEDGEEPVWWVNLYPKVASEFTEIGGYTAVLKAETGEALALLSAADGKG